VNADEDRQDPKALAEAGKVNWRSWWDGPDGPIVRQWNIDGFPTIYLIDAKGVLRYKVPFASREAMERDIEKNIDKLLKEAEGQPSS
jgi:hypothetical protein